MLSQRSNKNPVLKPNRKQFWEAKAVFNGCPVRKEDKISLLYRALSLPHYHALGKTKMVTSSIGMVESRDGINFSSSRKNIIKPELSWEKFGCEDPRVTKLKGKYYIFYTALSNYPFNPKGIKIGLALTKNLEKIEEKHLVTDFNSKGMALFPEKVKGKFLALLTVDTDKPPSKISLAYFEKEEDIWSRDYWRKWSPEKNSLDLQRNPQDHIETGAPPLKTEKGWLVIYSYIRNYFSAKRLFSVEAVLLDLKNPSKIIGRTKGPILTPEEYYEEMGMVSNVVFPSGAILEKEKIYLYYGAADTTCCLAFINLPQLLDLMLKEKRGVSLKRSRKNPIIIPNKNHSWESKAVFNPAALYLNNKVHLLYRAMSEDNTSVLGYAQSSDGVKIDYRRENPIYSPREEFEKKKKEKANSGCEDPRLTKMGDDIYMCYTAFDGVNLPRVALTKIKVADFLNQKWDWEKPVLISPPRMDDKDACLFPEKIKGVYSFIHRVGQDIDLAFTSKLDFQKGDWLGEYRWIYPRKGWWDSKKLGIGPPPLKTKEGWILFYHGISETGTYRVGAVLLDLENPINIIGRTVNPIFEPEKDYELKGLVPKVVFPCGAVEINGEIFVYYGGGDKVIGVAKVKTKKLLSIFKKYEKN